MDSVKIGTLCILGGCFVMLANTKIGFIIIGAGVVLMIAAEDKKEAPQPKPVQEEPRYRVVGNNVLMLDEEGNVLGTAALPEEKNQKKLTRKNR